LVVEKKNAIQRFVHPNNIWHSTSTSSLGSKYLNIQTRILVFNLNINIPGIGHLTKYNAKPPNTNIQNQALVNSEERKGILRLILFPRNPCSIIYT
jgi:hypothetical protein